MNDANRAYKNRQYKTHINLNKSFKSIEIEILLVYGWYKKIDGINMGKIWKKDDQKQKQWKKPGKKLIRT